MRRNDPACIGWVRTSQSGFTLLDVLVSIAVVAVLLGILLPTLSKVSETADRIKCGSNIRQIGIGIALYADENEDLLPPSAISDAHNMDVLRLGEPLPRYPKDRWDGLGRLYAADLLQVPEIFYCPSHTGDQTYERYAKTWHNGEGELIGNYQLRGVFPRDMVPSNTLARRWMISLPHITLVADAMRSSVDYSHKTGSNLLRADLSVRWFRDTGGALAGLLPENDGDWHGITATDLWAMLDGE